MGVVYLGYDPELDRRVALKILRGGTSDANRLSLLREAQAMARLTHPNVVAVHDVGEHDQMVYIAMEFIEGGTLSAWLDARPRSTREVVALFLLAARGLEAAHARELIHRDFKPEHRLLRKCLSTQRELGSRRRGSPAVPPAPARLDRAFARAGQLAHDGRENTPQKFLVIPAPSPGSPRRSWCGVCTSSELCGAASRTSSDSWLSLGGRGAARGAAQSFLLDEQFSVIHQSR